MEVNFFSNKMEAGGPHLTANLRDSNDILDHVTALRERLTEDGYLLIRALRKPQIVLSARRAVLERMQQNGLVAEGTPLMDRVIGPISAHGGTTEFSPTKSIDKFLRPKPYSRPV